MKSRAPRNQTLTCSLREKTRLSAQILYADKLNYGDDVSEKIICGDIFKVAEKLPRKFVDLLILDPPYNLSKDYNGHLFQEKDKDEYQTWFANMIAALSPTLKSTATIYVCSDWKTSALIVPILEKHFHVLNRITWEREKGRGAKSNWKNNTEDIWFCTMSDTYYFDVESVKLKRKVLAPYRVTKKPKDWQEEQNGNYRLTCPSNIWTDITVPFWSMPENTDHPTQKPEKLIAKLMLASSKEGDFIFDPFLGSGTSASVAKKLGRNFCGVEINEDYCCWALKRLHLAASDKTIQGYADGIFWERNTLAEQPVNIVP
ncbi:MAG: site-specific DNA-methyltransferase [Gammaproteobacteria bacterium]|nr:site-specific DNA-methyltransferase [Gammaproteobacteria bacterium]